MNTKFTILVAAGLLFAGVSQAQGTVASDFSKPHHEVVVRHEMKKAPHHKMHHKVKRHHKKMHNRKPGRH
jgi:hypothetical protein